MLSFSLCTDDLVCVLGFKAREGESSRDAPTFYYSPDSELTVCKSNVQVCIAELGRLWYYWFCTPHGMSYS